MSGLPGLREKATMETIGLVAAMSLESKTLLRHIGRVHRFKADSFRGARFQFPERECLLITSGMGSERAATAACSLLKMNKLQLLISFGIAGAVEADLEIGEVVAARESCLMEQGLPGKFHRLAALSEAAWNAAAQALQEEEALFTQGTILTTRGAQVVLKEAGEMLHPILDMETAGIAEAATQAGIPLLSLRSISDGPRSPLPLDLSAVMDDDYHFRIGRMIKMVLQKPGILSSGQQMMQNSRKAAEHAALAVLAVLRQPSPIIAN
jgi:adenosylhomocysteine nucleosidase